MGCWNIYLSLSSPRKKDDEKVSREVSRDGESGEGGERRGGVRRWGVRRRKIVEERDCDNT